MGPTMKKIRFFLSILFVLSVVHPPRAISENPPIEKKCVRGCSCYGFFAEFLWVLNYLQWCSETNQTPIVHWGEDFAYYSPSGYNGSLNCWEYYFEPVSVLKYRPGDEIDKKLFYNDHFSTITWYSEYINTLQLLPPNERKSIKALPLPGSLAGNNSYPSNGRHIYSKEFRSFVKKKLIDPFIVIKPSIQKKINSFYKNKMAGRHVIGLHLRGAFKWDEVGVVPVEALCEEANRYIVGGDTVFFVATDQLPLIERVKKLLKGKVVYYDSCRQESSTNPFRSAQWPPSMGEEVLIEAMLLSRCDHLVHTISNVSTAVLYFNPKLSHTMLYCGGVLKGNAERLGSAMESID